MKLPKAFKNRKRVLYAGLIVAVPAAVAVPIAGSRGLDCPSVEALRDYRPPEASRVFAADSSVVADLSPQRRVVVELKDTPALIRDGFVAIEDRRFWSHGGVDLRGIGRAVVRDVTSLSFREGFSTITMQLVRNVFPEQLPFGQRLRRKGCEVLLARRVEKELTKRQILWLYLNQITLGPGIYGVEAASRSYFGKPIQEVSPAEAAVIIGLAKNPGGYDPRKHPKRALQRRNVVLDVMAREGVLPAAEAARARAQPLRLAAPIEAAGPAPYFIAAVRTELQARFGPDADVKGLRVYTRLDPVLQRAAREALVAQIEKVEKGGFGKYRHGKPGPKLEPSSSPSGASPYLQGLVVALDPNTGFIKAVVGGRDFAHSQFDRALQARRQPGSSFKPFVYAAAIQQGMPISARVETTPLSIDGTGTPVWRPVDDQVPDSVTSISLRNALALSSNLASVRVGETVGPERVAELAKSLGLTTPIPPYPSIYLGAAEVIPVEMVAAFAAFGNGGNRIKPQLIERVEDPRGRVLWTAEPLVRPVLDPAVAYLTLSLMEDVVNRGTGAAARTGGMWQPAAGKTGTTNDAKDVWFVGLTPDVVAGVWLGFDRPTRIMGGASGGRLAAPVWGAIMKEYYKERPAPAPWAPPATLVTLAVDTTSGFLATGNCPPELVRNEFFLPGYEIQEYCPIHPQSDAERVFDKLLRGFKKIF